MTSDQRFDTGSVGSFEKNWEQRPEGGYVHWTRGEPANQTQLAFRQHWILFQELIAANWPDGVPEGMRTLEVGCGRGTLSMYFADAGYDCTLVDLAPNVVEIAESLFERNGLSGSFETADALDLPGENGSFDIVFSIGLLEHFENVVPPLAEQLRVLKPGGLLLVYVVPENPGNIQRDYVWINEILKCCQEQDGPPAPLKEDVFRTDYLAAHYVDALRELGMETIHESGVYPMPMISTSPEFPFSLNTPQIENILVKEFEQRIARTKERTGRNGWLCDDAYGQAFLVWGRK